MGKALQMGLLLAKRQPELADVLLGNMEEATVEWVWSDIVQAYQDFLRASGHRWAEKDRISPDHFHFEGFLAYYAVAWLREIATCMDKEWQRGWQKWFKGAMFDQLKSGEREKLVEVGGRVQAAILSGLVAVKIQPELLNVDWARGASLDMLWQDMLEAYRSHFKPFAERNGL